MATLMQVGMRSATTCRVVPIGIYGGSHEGWRKSVINTAHSAIMGESEKMLKHPSDPSNDLDWRSSVPDSNSTREIPLTRGKVAIVDAADYEALITMKWYATKRGPCWYAASCVPSGRRPRLHILMHRLLMGAWPGIQVDHINGNGLDNRRPNLRFADARQNKQNAGPPKNNKSGHKGVSWHASTSKWQAHIKYGGRTYYLGIFADKREAALAYENAARKLYGDFARFTPFEGIR